ncbi:MAG TPA: NAD(P)-dependent oxidoreductase [Vicinamibacterales bacterium]|nr:NAD(P)-dependent oxidoreductase [Vicinamibacterales bacterium]
MNIFIAGGTGVVGTRVVPMLASAGHSITAIVRTPEKRAALSRYGAKPVEVSLFDADRLRQAVRGHDAVINLATAIPPASKALMPGAWRANARIRRIGAANLARAAASGGATRYIQESFAPIYEDAGDRWIDESSPIRPARYNRAVVDAERAAQAFTGSGREGVVLRFAFFYGPDSDFLHGMIANVRRGWAPGFGPDAYISSISHDDAASAVVAALNLPAGIYNVADDEPVTKREFFGTLAAAVGAPEPRFPPSWVSHLLGSLGETLARSQRLSNRKLRGACAWSPRFPSVREGLVEAIAKRRRT